MGQGFESLQACQLSRVGTLDKVSAWLGSRHPCRESGFARGSPSSEGTLSGRHAAGMSAVRTNFRCTIFLRNQYGGCSSVGRASDCGSECRGFESRLPPHKTSRRKGRSVPLRPFAYDRPATLGCSQVVRHGTLTPAFAGSSPAIPAIRLVSSVGRATAF